MVHQAQNQGIRTLPGRVYAQLSVYRVKKALSSHPIPAFLDLPFILSVHAAIYICVIIRKNKGDTRLKVRVQRINVQGKALFDIHSLPTLENCTVLCAKGESDITSRFLLEVVLGWVQQDQRLAHSCPSSEVCCRDPIPRASLQLHCLTQHPALPRVRHIHHSWGGPLHLQLPPLALLHFALD
ncbi:hypothetical protein PIB30_061755 [Stylosanthes scabra]|uniref:Uncharacterized protein n=1 Tax=Stylosanthes scabra TaxID=79078 RepID=A0ABU6UJR1_9FABA|nr:hypothetical protein [Stylosanthes scabra]